jgi:ribonuclease BN (tRNA processing enzyme)
VTASGAQLVLLGTAGGPTWLNGGERAGISSALVVDGQVYLVDCGIGAGRQYFRAGLDLKDLRGIFITHLHSDHISEYFNLQLYGWFSNLELIDRPVQAFGPGPRGALPPVFPGAEPKPEVVNPDDPTPGLEAMTGYLMQAYATDINDRMRDNLKRPLLDLVQPHDIVLPDGLDYHPNDAPSPDMEPFEIYQDDRVRVTATLAQHAPVAPAFAFRFDTEYGSVAFSGDTGASANVTRLAAKASVLVHEVIDENWVRSRFGKGPYTSSQEALINHHLTAHTPVSQVGALAEEAGAATLVLNHLVPAHTPREVWQRAADGYSGELIVGEDLAVIPVGR